MAAAVGERVWSLSPPPLCSLRQAVSGTDPLSAVQARRRGRLGSAFQGVQGFKRLPECPVRGMGDCLIG